MTELRVPIFDRLPAIHRIRDAEQSPPDQLRAFAALLERALGEVHADIESLYHDLFIDTCAEWAIPYIADLLGTSHLTGDSWTLRAEVADTIHLRRRKGTRAAIERLAYDLTKWPVHAVELRDRLVWSQHLNHQRPDVGGEPPLIERRVGMLTVHRGGTVNLRHPATLSLIDTPFDPFARIPDVRPPTNGAIRHNLPNLAVFMWRLQDYSVPAARPVGLAPPRAVPADAIPDDVTDAAAFVVRFEAHPMGEPVVLFNRSKFNPHSLPVRVSDLDRMPGPIARARLNTVPRPPFMEPPDRGLAELAGDPARYVTDNRYDPSDPTTIEAVDTAIGLHMPDVATVGDNWTYRGANLCAWEEGLVRPLLINEIAIDPIIGRIAVGVGTEAAGNALLGVPEEEEEEEGGMRVTYTYGAVGPIGAHPISRESTEPAHVSVPDHTLAEAFAFVSTDDPLVIEIADSDTYDFAGGTIELTRSVIVRAADLQRPIIRLAAPLAFVPATGVDRSTLSVQLEGLYLTRGTDFPTTETTALISLAALDRLTLVGCTLDPGGAIDRHDELRTEPRLGLNLPDEEATQTQTTQIHIRGCITGAIRAGRFYRLSITESIIDAATGPYEDAATAGYAITGAVGAPDIAWGPMLQFDGVTVFGRVRVVRAGGQGGIFSQPLEVLDHQHGCIKYSWFAAGDNRLPQRHACLFGDDARLIFTSEIFGKPGYGQLADAADWRIRERGPGDDAMGSTGFLRHAHATRNLHIRFREFMPVGVRPLLVPVT